jgi:hypothetical protein
MSQLGLLIIIIRLGMLVLFVFFSLIPIITVINFILPQYYPGDFAFFLMFTLFTLGLSSIPIFGIISLRMSFRDISTLIYAAGLVFSFDDPYLLTFGVVSSWLFYEIWYVVNQFKYLDKEYSTYPRSSKEKKLLLINFRNQVISFLLQAWITLLLSWIVLYFASNFYFELGDEFGTLGIATSFAMLTIVYLTQRIVFPRKQKGKTVS